MGIGILLKWTSMLHNRDNAKKNIGSSVKKEGQISLQFVKTLQTVGTKNARDARACRHIA
jgi:hypothetical protein